MSTIKANKWENPDGTENYKCRAWVNFDGTTTPPTIRASGNVSSVVRNATGDYTINFTNAMPDTDFTAIGSVGLLNTTPEYASKINVNGPYSTTSLRIATGFTVPTAAALSDRSVVNVAIFR